jgi:Holliday junction DNA helicase RuvB
LDFYLPEELFHIIVRSAKILNIKIDDDGAHELAKRSRGTPRIANRLLRRTRDFAQVVADNKITKEVAQMALERLEIDEKGLDEMDIRILQTIIEKYQGGPVGIGTIAVAVGEEGETIEEVYEPYLIQQGFIKRTPRGRTVTALAYEHLNLKPDNQARQTSLFKDK